MFKVLKKNKNVIYYVIIAVLVYLIYTKLSKKESFRVNTENMSSVCEEKPEKSRNGCAGLSAPDGSTLIILDKEVSGAPIIFDRNANKRIWLGNRLIRQDGEAPFRLVMQRDRNLVVYDNKNRAIWASGTNLKRGERYNGPYRAELARGTLNIHDKNGEYVWGTLNGRFHVAYQESQGSKTGYFALMTQNGDGILQPTEDGLKYFADSRGAIKNHYGYRKGKGPVRLVMQDDRNLVVYDSNNNAIWASGTDLKPGEKYNGPYIATLMDNHTLYIVNKDNQIEWAKDLLN